MNNDDAMPTAILQSAPHHSTTTTATPSSSIVNPYLKRDETEIIPNSNDAANNAESPSSKKRNFITKYSHHRCSNNVPDVVTAAEIRRKRMRSIASSENDSCDGGSGYNSLCLFRDHSAADGRSDVMNNKNSMIATTTCLRQLTPQEITQPQLCTLYIIRSAIIRYCHY